MNDELARQVQSIFPDEPDQVALYQGGEHGTVLARLRQDLASGRRFLCLIGPPGSGKTRLMQTLREDFEQGIVGMAIPASESSLLFALMKGMGLQVPDRDEPAARQRLSVVLAMAEKKRTPVLQIIDAAERLERQDLNTIFQLFGPTFTQVVLAGRAELLDLLADGQRPLGIPRPDAVHRLEGLSAEETDAFIRHRLQQAQLPEDLFDAEASAEVHARSGGIPRSINALSRQALLHAEAAGADSIGQVVVRAIRAEDAPAVEAPRPQVDRSRRPATASPGAAAPTNEAPRPAPAPARPDSVQTAAPQSPRQRGSSSGPGIGTSATTTPPAYQSPRPNPDNSMPATQRGEQSAVPPHGSDAPPAGGAMNPYWHAAQGSREAQRAVRSDGQPPGQKTPQPEADRQLPSRETRSASVDQRSRQDSRSKLQAPQTPAVKPETTAPAAQASTPPSRETLSAGADRSSAQDPQPKLQAPQAPAVKPETTAPATQTSRPPSRETLSAGADRSSAQDPQPKMQAPQAPALKPRTTAPAGQTSQPPSRELQSAGADRSREQGPQPRLEKTPERKLETPAARAAGAPGPSVPAKQAPTTESDTPSKRAAAPKPASEPLRPAPRPPHRDAATAASVTRDRPPVQIKRGAAQTSDEHIGGSRRARRPALLAAAMIAAVAIGVGVVKDAAVGPGGVARPNPDASAQTIAEATGPRDSAGRSQLGASASRPTEGGGENSQADVRQDAESVPPGAVASAAPEPAPSVDFAYLSPAQTSTGPGQARAHAGASTGESNAQAPQPAQQASAPPRIPETGNPVNASAPATDGAVKPPNAEPRRPATVVAKAKPAPATATVAKAPARQRPAAPARSASAKSTATLKPSTPAPAELAALYAVRADYELGKGQPRDALISVAHGLQAAPGDGRLRDLRARALEQLRVRAAR